MLALECDRDRKVVTSYEGPRSIVESNNPDIICKIDTNNAQSIREIASLSTLQDSPYILKLYRVDLDVENTIYVEKLAGDLSTFMRIRPLIIPNLKTIFYQMAMGLYHAHSKMIMHRDIKPQNIFLTIVEGRLRAVLGDWGSSRRFEAQDRDEYTNHVQTLWYEAPELLLGNYNYSSKIDIWGLGLVVAEMCNGAELCTGRNEVDQLFAIFRLIGTPDTYRNIFPPWDDNRTNRIQTFDPLLLDVILQMLEFDPTTRIDIYAVLNHPYFDGIRADVIVTPDPYTQFLPADVRIPAPDSSDLKQGLYKICIQDQLFPRTFFLACKYLDFLLPMLTTSGHLIYPIFTPTDPVDRLHASLACLYLADAIADDGYGFDSAEAFDYERMIAIRNYLITALHYNLYLDTEFQFLSILAPMTTKLSSAPTMTGSMIPSLLAPKTSSPIAADVSVDRFVDLTTKLANYVMAAEAPYSSQEVIAELLTTPFTIQSTFFDPHSYKSYPYSKYPPDKYFAGGFSTIGTVEYRWEQLAPRAKRPKIPKNRTLTVEEWKKLGIELSPEWQHIGGLPLYQDILIFSVIRASDYVFRSPFSSKSSE